MPERMRGERLQVMLSPEELAALDDFRFNHRMPSRASAIREILRRGLASTEKVSAAGSRSSDFGVLRPQPSRRKQP
jgi:metal-responsive CopG/Arc/MetJ family transcriptional regulator